MRGSPPLRQTRIAGFGSGSSADSLEQMAGNRGRSPAHDLPELNFTPASSVERVVRGHGDVFDHDDVDDDRGDEDEGEEDGDGSIACSLNRFSKSPTTFIVVSNDGTSPKNISVPMAL